MKVIIGLGNPGVDYANTRHNAGVCLVEKMGQVWRRHDHALVCKTPEFILIKTKDVFMNESGRLLTSPPTPLLISGEGGNLYVAHDDLDIRLGEFKIQKGVGPKLHYGIQSVEQALKTKDFWRIRIGVDNRDPQNRISGDDYVLQKFTNEEKAILDKVLEEISNKLIPHL